MLFRVTDFNLLLALDVLLAEGSVARAARRLRLSPSAMSRTLTRLREATGDPLLVRSGRALVPTPRAVELRERVGPLVQAGRDVLTPQKHFNLEKLSRTFTVRTSDGFVENVGPALLSRIQADAPLVHLRFVQKADKDHTSLREGIADIETGVVDVDTAPDLKVQALFRDRLVGVVRQGHPLAKGKMTAARYAAAAHVTVARKILERGPIDEALELQGLSRETAMTVGGFSSALALARGSDLVATVPERHTGNLRGKMHTFSLPVTVAPLTVSLLWHPRLDADPAHRWLRRCVVDACRTSLGPSEI